MQQKIKEMWKEKSRSFPVYDESDLDDMKTIRSVIALAEDRGVRIAGKKLIDIGCGTGRYTLSLAGRAGSVVGTDLSAEMIEVLERTAAKYDMRNTSTRACDWKEADIDAFGWRGAFDVAWAAMTSALDDSASIEKMNACAREWCVAVAWGRKRDNEVLSKVMAAHGAELRIPAGASIIIEELERRKAVFTVDYVENAWSFEGTREEVYRDAAWHVKMSDLEPVPEKIYGIIDAHAKNGEYSHSTVMEMGVVIWRPFR